MVSNGVSKLFLVKDTNSHTVSRGARGTNRDAKELSESGLCQREEAEVNFNQHAFENIRKGHAHETSVIGVGFPNPESLESSRFTATSNLLYTF